MDGGHTVVSSAIGFTCRTESHYVGRTYARYSPPRGDGIRHREYQSSPGTVETDLCPSACQLNTLAGAGPVTAIYPPVVHRTEIETETRRLSPTECALIHD